MAYPDVVTRDEWLAARKRLLATEKAHGPDPTSTG